MLEVNATHDCTPPDMSRPPVVFSNYRGIWPFRRVETTTVKTNAREEARWTCPVCGSKWHYSGAYGEFAEYGGYWKCIERTSRWVKIEEV